MDFKQIEAFVNVVRFSRAADVLLYPANYQHAYQFAGRNSTLNCSIGKGRTVEMTPHGQKFYQYAVEMVNARAQAIEALDNGDDNLDGVQSFRLRQCRSYLCLETS